MVEVFNMAKGEEMRRALDSFEIVFVPSGEIEVIREGLPGQVVGSRKFFMLTPEVPVTYLAREESRIVVGDMEGIPASVRNPFLGAMDHSAAPVFGSEIFCLEFNEPIGAFVKGLDANLRNGLTNDTYLSAKYTEFLCLVREYYSPEQCASFFRPMLGRDMEFRSFVYRNAVACNSVREFAARAHMTEVGFRKRFIREMGISPVDFMIGKKKTLILNELRNGDKSFKQICDEYDIPHQAHLSRFCRTQFGDTPSNIRRGSAAG